MPVPSSSTSISGPQAMPLTVRIRSATVLVPAGGQARAKNVGWRLHYQMITPGLVARVRAADIYTAENFSDHAPQTMEYALELRS
jgi:hypothetical protein